MGGSGSASAPSPDVTEMAPAMSLEAMEGSLANVFQAAKGTTPNPRLKNSTGTGVSSTQRLQSAPLSMAARVEGGRAAAAPGDNGTGLAVPNTQKQVEGDTVQISQAPMAVPAHFAVMPSGDEPAAASAGVMPAPAPVQAHPGLRLPRTPKTTPVILESIPLRMPLQSSMRGLLAAGATSGAASDVPAAAPLAAVPAPASTAADLVAFRNALAAELSAASQAAATPAPAPGTDRAWRASSPVAGAVAALAARLEREQPSPALAAQLLATQSLLEAAVQVRVRAEVLQRKRWHSLLHII